MRTRKELDSVFYILSVFAALILLAVGLSTTMIEIDARIQSMDFHLLGQSISFKNQSLFFQSKSIVDVVVLLIKTGKVDSAIVGSAARSMPTVHNKIKPRGSGRGFRELLQRKNYVTPDNR